MRTLLLPLVLVLTVVPAPAQAWGYAGHKLIVAQAIALLPPELRPLFEKYRDTLIERSIDPDTWRTAGFEDEPPNHQVDMDWEGFGKYPFTGLPRDYTAAVAKFGRARIAQEGTLPWRGEEMYGALRRAFETAGRRGRLGQNDVIFYSAWLAHYVSDAHVPLHAVVNYDGQLTQQWGVHSRWETGLIERFAPRLALAPTPLPPVRDPRNFLFDRLVESTQLVPALLKADADAIGARDVYDAAYFDAFFVGSRVALEKQLNESIAGVAAMITGAWEAAGKPVIAVDLPDTPQRRRRQ